MDRDESSCPALQSQPELADTVVMSISETSGPNVWCEPVKQIRDERNIADFRRSTAYRRLKEALAVVVDKIKGQDFEGGFGCLGGPSETGIPMFTTISASHTNEVSRMNSNYNGVLQILEELGNILQNHPPIEGPRRFGNLACRDWHDELKESAPDLLLRFLIIPEGIDSQGFRIEAQTYLCNSFGSQTRLDYGTGHELSFLAFLGGLIRLEIIPANEINGQQMLTLWARYYGLVRQLITEYNLEPAGSHGVWGLDDHFHLIYIFGAAQFVDNKLAPPVSQVTAPRIFRQFETRNLYVNAIAFIHKIKSGPFREHSPILNDIHGSVILWSKVLQGLLKMYDVEVFSKVPVMQHFWFGVGMYPWKDEATHKILKLSTSEIQVPDQQHLSLASNPRTTPLRSFGARPSYTGTRDMLESSLPRSIGDGAPRMNRGQHNAGHQK